jgi:lipopolysaccharide export system permease protein
MMRLKRMDAYLASTVVVNALLVLLVLTALASVITFVSEVRSLSSTYTLLEAARYTLYKIPGGMYDMFTVAVLLGALLGLGELATHNELTVLRVAGVSVARLGLSAMTGGLLLAAVCMCIGEFIVPNAEQKAEDRRAELVQAKAGVFGAGGVWAKDGRYFVNVRALRGGDTALGVNIFNVSDDRQLLSATFAVRAEFSGDHSVLRGVRSTSLDGQGAKVFRATNQPWNTSLDPDLLNLFAADTNTLSAADLYDYIQYRRANQLDDHRYVAAFWSHVAKPVALLGMLLLAMPFVFGPLRSSSTGQRLLVGMLIGIGFYVFNSMFMQTGIVFNLSPLLTAWLPTLLLVAIGAFAVNRIH